MILGSAKNKPFATDKEIGIIIIKKHLSTRCNFYNAGGVPSENY
ncbi:MAG: hypothetical protein U0T80_00895 [Flavobacteriaceae bacterium]